MKIRNEIFLGIAALLLCSAPIARGAGVTIITHGLDGNADGWVTGMADQIPNYTTFFGTSNTFYKFYFVSLGGGSYQMTWTRLGGSQPTSTDSGEIIVALDWSQLADGNSFNTYQIAGVVASVLQSTNFISELNGHAACEFPLHLIGHSRGGSVMSEVSLRLGTNGVWVDHLTTLDPHPLNNDGFNLDALQYSAIDAPVRTYQNVLFHDNYWQNIAFLVYGEPVSGAYIRQLYDVSGGYQNVGDLHYPHSNVHLWYHATVDERNPASDSEAQVTSTEFNNWYVSYEQFSYKAGFIYSLIGRGDRTSTDQPVGPGFPAIRDGYNQWWDLGAGVANNRTALPANNGNWPNLVKFNRTTTNQIVQGQGMPVKYYYQWAQPSSSLATISIYLDDDLNPINTNQTFLRQITVPGNGASSISFSTTNLTLDASVAAPGYHAVLAKITAGGRTRYLYAPELVEVISIRQPPTLDIAKLNATQYRVGVNGLPGQMVVLQNSTNLQTWSSIVTNTLATNRWTYTNTPPSSPGTRYYRGVLP